MIKLIIVSFPIGFLLACVAWILHRKHRSQKKTSTCNPATSCKDEVSDKVDELKMKIMSVGASDDRRTMKDMHNIGAVEHCRSQPQPTCFVLDARDQLTSVMTHDDLVKERLPEVGIRHESN